MSDYIRNLLKMSVRQIITVMARRNESGYVEEISLDSEITREFVNCYNAEVRKMRDNAKSLENPIQQAGY